MRFQTSLSSLLVSCKRALRNFQKAKSYQPTDLNFGGKNDGNQTLLSLRFLRFFICVSWGNFPSTNLADHADYSYTSLKNVFSSFYNSLFWNLEICSHLFFFLFFPLFFPALHLIHPSILFNSFFWSLLCFLLAVYSLYFLMSLIVLFSNLLERTFFFLSSYSSILSTSPLCSITIQSVLFLLEPSIWYFVLSLFDFASVFFMLLLFYKDLKTFPVLFSLLFATSVFTVYFTYIYIYIYIYI